MSFSVDRSAIIKSKSTGTQETHRHKSKADVVPFCYKSKVVPIQWKRGKESNSVSYHKGSFFYCLLTELFLKHRLIALPVP